MGTLEQQTEKYNEAIAFVEGIKGDPAAPFKLSQEQLRQYSALFNQASFGAFRHAPPDSTKGLGTRDKQQWEALGNIPKTEAMRRYVDKADKMRIDYNLAANAAKYQ